MNKKDQIRHLKNAVCLKFGHTVESSSDFNALSLSIMEATAESVSPSTLKRVFGYVKYDADPSITTLSILARYVGYSGWSDFLDGGKSNSATRQFPRWITLLLTSAVIISAIIAAVIISNRSDKDDESSAQTVYDTILETCLDEAEARCDEVVGKYGKMNITDYFDYVQKEYYKIVFTDLKELVAKETDRAFKNDSDKEKYNSAIFSVCRNYCINRLLTTFPFEELYDAYENG